MSRKFAYLMLAFFAASGAFFGTASAAELPIQPRSAIAVAPGVTSCGCCGCLVVTHVRHRQLAMTYGYALDPRQRDEPRYYMGPMRSFARYQTVYPVQYDR